MTGQIPAYRLGNVKMAEKFREISLKGKESIFQCMEHSVQSRGLQFYTFLEFQ
jgi:hypothetical protein